MTIELADLAIDPEFEKHLAAKMREHLVAAAVRRVAVIADVVAATGCTSELAALALISLGVDAIGADMAECLYHHVEARLERLGE